MEKRNHHCAVNGVFFCNFRVIIIKYTPYVYISSGGARGRLAGARAPARKFFPASPFVK